MSAWPPLTASMTAGGSATGLNSTGVPPGAMSLAVAAPLIKASNTVTGTRAFMGILRNYARDDDCLMQYQPDGRASTDCGGIMMAAQAAPASASAAASSMISRMLSA